MTLLTQQNIVLLSNDPHTPPYQLPYKTLKETGHPCTLPSSSNLHALLHVAYKSTPCAVMFRLRNISQEGVLQLFTIMLS